MSVYIINFVKCGIMLILRIFKLIISCFCFFLVAFVYDSLFLYRFWSDHSKPACLPFLCEICLYIALSTPNVC